MVVTAVNSRTVGKYKWLFLNKNFKVKDKINGQEYNPKNASFLLETFMNLSSINLSNFCLQFLLSNAFHVITIYFFLNSVIPNLQEAHLLGYKQSPTCKWIRL